MKTSRMLPAFVRPASRHGTRWVAAGAAAVLGLTSSIMVGIPASAANAAKVAALRERLPDAAVVHSQVHSDGVKVTRYKFSGDQAKNQRKAWKPDRDEQASIDKHIAAQMRAGRNIRSESVDVLAFEVPGKMVFHLVQGKNDVLDEFAVTVQENEKGHAMRFMAAYTDDAHSTTGTDAGFENGIGHNLTRRGYGNRTVYFTPDYSHTGSKHWVTQNYEKWQSNTEWNWWAYNSYATFDAANPASGYAASLRDATIRARPWNKNANGHVTGGPYSYQPRPEEVCQPVATLGINVGAYGSLELPAVNCYSGQEIYPEAGQHMMGTAWYGGTTAQRYLDFSFSFTTCCFPTIPIMSDYIWMSASWCHSWYPDCGWEDEKWTDGGW